MKIIHIITFTVISTFFLSKSYSQIVTTNEAQKLAEVLNSNSTDSIHLSFNKDQALLKFNEVNQNLDIRTKSSITRDSMSKKEIKEKYYSNGRYIGDVFWQYDFDSFISKKSSFKATSSGKLFFKLDFSENDTIFIKSSLNEFTSHHRTLDSYTHKVHWSGDKYISVLLKPKKNNDTIKFEVSGITLSGKFERKDQQPIHKDYSKKLRDILKREFKKAFDEIVLKTDNKNFKVYKATDLKGE